MPFKDSARQNEANRKSYAKYREKRLAKMRADYAAEHPLRKKREQVLGRTAEYRAYRAAITRCTNSKQENYRHYGGRGIRFLFTSFEEFYKELGAKPGPEYSVDRKNNNGHYERGNVRWALKADQMRNRRRWAA